MSALEIIVLILAVALVLFTVAGGVIRRRKGRSCCGSDGTKKEKNPICSGSCGSCPYADACRKQ